MERHSKSVCLSVFCVYLSVCVYVCISVCLCVCVIKKIYPHFLLSEQKIEEMHTQLKTHTMMMMLWRAHLSTVRFLSTLSVILLCYSSKWKRSGVPQLKVFCIDYLYCECVCEVGRLTLKLLSPLVLISEWQKGN